MMGSFHLMIFSSVLMTVLAENVIWSNQTCPSWVTMDDPNMDINQLDQYLYFCEKNTTVSSVNLDATHGETLSQQMSIKNFQKFNIISYYHWHGVETGFRTMIRAARWSDNPWKFGESDMKCNKFYQFKIRSPILFWSLEEYIRNFGLTFPDSKSEQEGGSTYFQLIFEQKPQGSDLLSDCNITVQQYMVRNEPRERVIPFPGSDPLKLLRCNRSDMKNLPLCATFPCSQREEKIIKILKDKEPGDIVLDLDYLTSPRPPDLPDGYYMSDTPKWTYTKKDTTFTIVWVPVGLIFSILSGCIYHLCKPCRIKYFTSQP